MIKSISMRMMLVLIPILMVAPGLNAQGSNADSITTNEHILAFQYQMPVKGSDAYARLQKIINLDLQNATLEEALISVADQVGLKLMYSKVHLQDGKKLSYENKILTAYKALWEILDDTDLQFAISNNQQLVVLRNRNKFRSELEANTISQEQTGSITGRIMNTSTGEALFGASILVENTSIGNATSIDGEYKLQGLPAGKQNLIVRYLGYKTRNIEVTIVAGENIEKDIFMELYQLEGEEVVIGAQALGQARAIREQLYSNTIVNVISEARLRELPDANVAESVGRLPGVALVRDAGEGQKVAIRGMGPQYSSITINGNRIPSTDLEDRSVDLSMISPEMISSIKVYKSLRPDMDADAIGGSVDFGLSGAPLEPSYSVSLDGGYNNIVGGIGSRKGSFRASNRFFDDRLGVLFSAAAERVNRDSHVFRANYNILRDAREGEAHPPMETIGLTLTNREEVRDRFGAGINLDYKIAGGRLFFNNFMSRLNRDEWVFQHIYDPKINSQKFGSTDNDIQVDVFSSSLGGEHDILGAEINWWLSRNGTSHNMPYSNNVEFRNNNAFDPQKLDLEDGPDNIYSASALNMDNAFLIEMGNEMSAVNERDLTASFDIQIPVNIGSSIDGYVKFGGKHYNKKRDRDNDLYRRAVPSGQPGPLANDGVLNVQFTDEGRLAAWPFFDPGFRSPSNFLGGNYDLPYGIDRNRVNLIWERHQPDKQTTGEQWYEGHTYYAKRNNHDATERISAGYIMTELNIGQRLMLLPGVRYEVEHSDYTAIYGIIEAPREAGSALEPVQFQDTTATRNVGTWHPMFNVRYKPLSWFDIRMARTVTTSRPDFLHVSPRTHIIISSAQVRRGNTNLKPMLAINYDVFFTFNSNKLGLLTIGGFYKEVKNLIYTRDAVIIDQSTMGLPSSLNLSRFRIEEPVNNPNLTTVRGVELEWQSNLNWLPKPLNGLVLNANYSRMYSKTQYPQFYFERTTQGVIAVDTTRKGNMLYQPDHLINVNIGYDYKGFSTRVSMQYQGKTLLRVGPRPISDAFTEDYLRFDASILQRFYNGMLTVYLDLNNITNRPDRARQFSEEFPTDREYYGWAADLGIRLRF